ncbi:EpsI family protein [Desulfobacterales bacterium]|nr:EpsI family protein [Desulfobacterales bacterium]
MEQTKNQKTNLCDEMMNISTLPFKRYIIVILLAISTAIIIFKIQNIEPIENKKLFDFPMAINQWTGVRIPMEPWVFESLETPYSILRNYVSPDGQTINLAIVWYDDREIAFHGAAACLGGAGNKVTEMEPYEMMIDGENDIRIARLITTKTGREQIVFYYYINEGYISPSQINIRKHIILRRLKFKRTSAAFIRIMMPVVKDNASTEKILAAFVKESLPIISEYTATN